MASTYCIFSALYPPHVGGVEAFTDHLAHALTLEGNRVIVVTSDISSEAGIIKGDPLQGEPESLDAAHAVVDVVRFPHRGLLGGRYPVPQKNPTWHQLASWLGEQSIDHVIVNTRFYPLSLVGVQFAAAHGIVPVVIEHGSAHLTIGSTIIDKGVQAVEHAMTERIKRSCAVYYGVSEASCAWLEHFGITARGVISNAIDADRFLEQSSRRDFRKELGIGEDDVAVCFTGRLAPEKGPDRLAEAVCAIAQKGGAKGRNGKTVAVHALIAGDGALRPELERLAEKSQGTVHVLGSMSPSDIASLLISSNIFCLPTRSEGFSTSLLEAAAAGCALVITDVGGVSELIDGPNRGIILPDSKPASIASALEYLAVKPKKTKAMGKRVAKTVRKRFCWEETARKAAEACLTAQHS